MSPIQVRLHTRRFRFRWAVVIAANFLPLLLISPPAFAAKSTKKAAKAEAKKLEEPKEVLIFKNGDQITGKLLNSTGTKIKFDSEVAGEITVPLENIKELKSDRPFAIVPKEPKGFKKRAPVVEGIIQLEAKGIIVVPVTQEKAKELAEAAAKPEAKPSEAKPIPPARLKQKPRHQLPRHPPKLQNLHPLLRPRPPPPPSQRLWRPLRR